MQTSEASVIGVVVIASAFNVAGTFMASSQDYKKDPFVPVIAGFVIGTLLLALYQVAPELAEAFGVAFMITSTLENGKPVIDALTVITQNGGKSA
jgi:hypothetical protein